MTRLGVEATEQMVQEATGHKPGERITLDHIKSLIIAKEWYHPNHTPHMTICTLKLRNGFVVMGDSTPADPQKFDSQLGAELSMNAAIAKIWPFEGYLLRENLWRKEQTAGASMGQQMPEVTDEPETVT